MTPGPTFDSMSEQHASELILCGTEYRVSLASSLYIIALLNTTKSPSFKRQGYASYPSFPQTQCHPLCHARSRWQTVNSSNVGATYTNAVVFVSEHSIMYCFCRSWLSFGYSNTYWVDTHAEVACLGQSLAYHEAERHQLDGEVKASGK